MECSRSGRPMMTSEVGTDWAGRVKHDLYVGNMGSKCIQSHTPYSEFNFPEALTDNKNIISFLTKHLGPCVIPFFMGF